MAALLLLSCLIGCGSKQPKADGPLEARLKALEKEKEELSERLAWAEQGARAREASTCEDSDDDTESLDDFSAKSHPARPTLQVVKLVPGAATAAPSARDAERSVLAPSEPSPDSAGHSARPLLRLHGSQPARVLHVVEEEPKAVPPPAAAGRPPAEAGQGSGVEKETEPKALYEAALALVRERRFQEAAAALGAFLESYSDHPYSDNALYWLGECHYARGDYGRARGEFERLIQRYPHENKVPDAWLKLGLSHQRLGDDQAARSAFGQLQRTHPDAPATRRIPARYLGKQP